MKKDLLQINIDKKVKADLRRRAAKEKTSMAQILEKLAKEYCKNSKAIRNIKI